MQCPKCRSKFWDVNRKRIKCIDCGFDIELEVKAVVTPRFNSIH